LLIQRVHGEEVVPKRLQLSADTLALATELIALFRGAQGGTRGELEADLQVLEGDQTDYRVKRGLAHHLASDFSTFEGVSPIEPAALRQRVFAVSAPSVPSPQQSLATLTAVADALSRELSRDISPEQVRAWLYADLPEAHVLTSFEAPTPEVLLHRYNLAQAQGVLYRASQVVITAHRNDPGEYKLLFRYLKLFGLMAYTEGDAEHGFTLTIDGPASLFTVSPRYGLALAKLLPALLHVTRWHLTATLVPRRLLPSTPQGTRFTLEAGCDLVSHYPPGKPYDSILEQAFAARWAQTPTAWRLEREVDLIPLPGSVMVPDFRLVHPDGRNVLLEIVGYWRPEYLRKKFAQVRRAGRKDVILAVSERLNLERAGVKRDDIPARVVWFKDRLLPKAVLAMLEGSGAPSISPTSESV
jgi:predicted nuclease of restriction endonuclease-like RecB superfamily